MSALKTLAFAASLLFMTLVDRAIALTVNPFAPIHDFWTAPTEIEVAYFRAQKLVESIQKRKAIGKFDVIQASTCRKTLVLSEFLNRSDLAPTQKRITPSEMAPRLSLPAETASDLFQLIELSTVGSAILKRFLTRYPYELKLEMKEPGAIRQQKVNAFAIYDPIKKTIWIDKQAPRGIVAFVLLHEIVHALDRDAANAVRKLVPIRDNLNRDLRQLVNSTASKRRKARDQLVETDFIPQDLQRLAERRTLYDQMLTIEIYRAERFAYDAAYDVWRDLARLFPSYYRKEPFYYDDDHIVRLNRLNAAYVEKFRQGLCTVYKNDQWARTPSNTP